MLLFVVIAADSAVGRCFFRDGINSDVSAS